MTVTVAKPASRSPDTLASLLGGRRGALDATLPIVAFLAGYLIGHGSVGWGAGSALVVAVGVAAWRLSTGAKPRAVLAGALVVAASALIALRTGKAEDFFLLQILTNAVSALAWAVSIALRWPFLGLIVGTALGQKTRWRRDPVLLRAYSRASWVWVGQYLIRLVVFVPLWAAGEVVALAITRGAFTYPLVAACIAVSGWVLFRAIPPGHPGLRHPVAPEREKAVEPGTDATA